MARANNIVAFVVFLIILCAVLAVYLLYKSNVSIVKHSRHYPNKMLIYDDYSFRDDSFVYLVCDDGDFPKCKIVQEKYPYKTIFKSCNVTPGIQKVDRASKRFIFVVAFGEDKAVLLWNDDNSKHDKPYVNISVVHMNGCKQERTINTHLFTTEQLNNVKKILTHDDTFVVFFKNTAECGINGQLDRECTLRFKSDGHFDHLDKFIDNSKFNISNIHSADLTNNRYVYIKSRNGHTDLYLSNSNKTEHMLLSLSGDFKISVVNELIGVCSKIGKNTTCYQYDFKGRISLKTSLTDVHNNTELKNIYSLPEGGFLLSYAEFGRCEEEDECYPDWLTNYFIQKIDATGKPIGKVGFIGLEKGYKVINHSYIWKAEKEGEYCAFIEPFRQSDKIDFFVNCFPIANFDA
ncbi:uncharacterized protein LOC131669929 [Phymastichus coffea]|uniref:uncharacterized protein LOC131669929 n=1 Tax=Phymastichus coffea TaxID=108790 RepID=UPI00273A89EB|nr:uncharacterized protein LOC131669929 [Phymastichus coffea]